MFTGDETYFAKTFLYSQIKKALNKIKIKSNNPIGEEETDAAISVGDLKYWNAAESSLNPHALYNSRSNTVKKEITSISKIV